MEWSPASIADLYQCRWSIEVFFKQIKQTLQVDATSSDTIRTRQVWMALC